MVDYRKSVEVPMFNNRTGEHDFTIQLYGRRPRELMTVPNDVINTLAERYPEHTSSPFLLIDRSRIPEPPAKFGFAPD